MAIDLDEKFIDLSSQIIFRIKDLCMSYNECLSKSKKSFRRKILHILNKFFKFLITELYIYIHQRPAGQSRAIAHAYATSPGLA